MKKGEYILCFDVKKCNNVVFIYLFFLKYMFLKTLTFSLPHNDISPLMTCALPRGRDNNPSFPATCSINSPLSLFSFKKPFHFTIVKKRRSQLLFHSDFKYHSALCRQ